MFCFSVWVARRPPGYAFIDFDDPRDARDAIHELDGMYGFFCCFVLFFYWYMPLYFDAVFVVCHWCFVSNTYLNNDIT